MSAADLELNRYDDSSEDSDDAQQQAASLWLRIRRAGVLRAAAVGGVAAVALTTALAVSSRGAPRAEPSAAIGLSSAGQAAASQAAAVASSQLTTGSSQAVAPKEHLSDGNSCPDDEELHAGLCYAKCSYLTGGQYSFRQSAWTCCRQATCTNPFSFASCCKHNMGWCSGFDVSGSQESNPGSKPCPHKPGACLQDEELFLNVCYMKCSTLTGGLYPYRTAPATCCKHTDISCMAEDGLTDGLNGQSLTNSSFEVGGGCHDDHANTHCQPHMPQQALTEV